jgi:hypothetical protein
VRQFLIQFVAGGVGGGVGAILLLMTIRLPRFDLGLFDLVILVLAVVPLLFVVFGLHELGHLLAGAAVRFRPCLYIVGPLKLERTRPDRGWQAGVNRCVPLFGGMAAGIPDSVDNLRHRMAVLIAGGPGASLLTGLAALAVLIAVRAPSGERYTLAGPTAVGYLALLVFCLLSILVAMSALVPSTTKGYSSDGKQLLRFFRNDDEVEAEVALTAVSLASLAGQRPRDWDRALLRRALALAPDTPRGALARLIAHSHALDRGDIEAARVYLNEGLTHREVVPQMSRPALLLQGAYFAAIHDADPIRARQYFDAAGHGALLGAEGRLIAEAAVLHAEGKPGVEPLLEQAEAGLDNTMDRGGAKLASDEIADLRARRASV